MIRKYWFTSINCFALVIILFGSSINPQYDDGGLGGLYFVFLLLFGFMFLLAEGILELVVNFNAGYLLIGPLGLFLAYCVDLVRIQIMLKLKGRVNA